MLLSTVLTPLSDQNLAYAAQCGVSGVVHRYPGPCFDELLGIQRRIESFDLSLVAIEGYLPLEHLKMGSDDGKELQAMKVLINQMGDVGIPLLCYNFMIGTDWVRTNVTVPERGGARVTAFDIREVPQAQRLNYAPDVTDVTFSVRPDDLWDRLERLLNELVPVAEKSGVTLAMHPDDPPVSQLLGNPRIMNSVESFERLMRIVPSPHNGICFCQGTFAAMGVDIPAAIHRLGQWIHYVHFRDVRGTPEAFTETFHDNGPTDMVAAMRAYREIGFRGPIRPDHVPMYFGEDGEPGYTMLGRLFAYGYLKGLLQATE